MIWQMGWRNIWRNPRRTIVIMIAVVIGIWNMIFLGALMRGVADQMVRNGIATLTGHIQVQHKGYRRDPVIENSIAEPKAVVEALESDLPPGANWAPRLRVNAIVSNARHSRGATLVGIDPQREAAVSFIGQVAIDGRYLEAGDGLGIMIGRKMAENFETGLGRKLVLMAQDSSGEIASRAFRIAGIYRAELEATEAQFVFVTLPAAQEMLKLPGGISEASILLASSSEAEEAADRLRSALPSDEYAVFTWQQLLPALFAVLKMYDVVILLWYLAVFIAMGFGIVNTTLMAVFERIREFGLMKALGMKPLWIVREVLVESVILLVMGMAAGNLLGFLSVLALHGGIDLSSLALGLEFAGMPRVVYPVIMYKDVASANLMVLLLGLLVSLYPAVKAARFTPVEALAYT